MRLVQFAIFLVVTTVAAGLALGPEAGTRAGVAGFTVDTTLDDPDNSLVDGLCDTGEGVCSLRAAVQQLNAYGGTHTITVPAGTYSLSFGAAGEDAAATGDLDLTANNLRISGAGAGVTIIQKSGGLSTHRVFDVISGTHTINNVTIQNGLGDGGNGGGIRVANNTSLTLNNVMVTGNIATGVGGGVLNSGTLNVNDSMITLNNAAGVAGEGGGIGNGGTATISESTVSFNFAGSLGGGLNNLGGTLNVLRSTLKGNQTGGGVGAGIRNRFGAVTLVNSTVSGNVNNGGLSNFQADTTITNSTIVGNGGGGVISIDGTGVTIRNTILSGNAGGSCSGGVTSSGYNIDDGNSCAFTAPGDQPNTNPQIGPLQNNGGPTETHDLFNTSPAIDSGNPAYPGSGGDACPAYDQRGVHRPVEGDGLGLPECDIGAVEYCVAGADPDGDGFTGGCDNCPNVANSGQIESDGDLAGDDCDAAGLGNVDCNNAVNSVDALKVLRYSAGLSVTQNEPCIDIGTMFLIGGLMGDVDCLTAVNSVDALKILRAVAGLSVSQGPGCPPVIPKP